MVGTKTDNADETRAGGGRVVVSSGAIEWRELARPSEGRGPEGAARRYPAERAASVPETRTSASGYVGQTLPISLSKPAIPPWARELTRLLDGRARARDELVNLRSVERLLRMPGADASDLPDEVVRAAGLELRWLARREVPSRALARLLDQFEHELLQPALRRLQRAREHTRP